jgi:3-oxoisoapionate kinase
MNAVSTELLLAFYGDDFTGSTDAMEALALSGLRTVLFLSPPTTELLRSKFADLRCVGVAGTSRAMSPREMDSELKPILQALWAIGAPLTHYKVCSTFDSSPAMGSIGHVIDMARHRCAATRFSAITSPRRGIRFIASTGIRPCRAIP